MATESNVAINPDSVAAGAHNVRTVTVTPLTVSPVVVNQTEQQQVVTLADEDGNLFTIEAGAIKMFNDEMTLLLKGILVRLDLLNDAVRGGDYQPPDGLYDY